MRPRKWKKLVAKQFKQFDDNHDNILDDEELYQLLATYMDISESDCRKWIKAFDHDGSGGICTAPSCKLQDAK